MRERMAQTIGAFSARFEAPAAFPWRSSRPWAKRSQLSSHVVKGSVCSLYIMCTHTHTTSINKFSQKASTLLWG